MKTSLTTRAPARMILVVASNFMPREINKLAARGNFTFRESFEHNRRGSDESLGEKLNVGLFVTDACMRAAEPTHAEVDPTSLPPIYRWVVN